MLCARFAGADKDVVVPWCRVEDLLPSRHAEELRSRQTDLSSAYWDEVDREGMAKEGRQPEVEELQSAEEECLVLREGKLQRVQFLRMVRHTQPHREQLTQATFCWQF